MSRYFLDTNAVIALLKGNQQIQNMVKDANWLGISVITEIEFFAYDRLDPEGKELFNQFHARIELANLNGHDRDLIMECIRLRKETGIKLPDAVIAAQSRLNNSVLITNDKYFHKISGLKVMNFDTNKE